MIETSHLKMLFFDGNIFTGLVSKAKDKNKIKKYERREESDISLKCILYWQTSKDI